MATVKEIAEGLIELCRNGRFLDAIDRYYSPDIVSVECVDFGLGKEQRGVDAIRSKNIWWGENHEVHGIKVEGPFLGSDQLANQFAVRFMFDITPKSSGKRFTFAEMALYTVEKDKLAREEFFYPAA